MKARHACDPSAVNRPRRAAVSGLYAVALLLAVGELRAEAKVSFSRDVAPVLQQHCVSCHGPRRAEAGLRLDTYARIVAEVEGRASVAPGNAAKSELYVRLVADDEDSRMPAEADPLAIEKRELIRKWIEEGATFDGDTIRTPLADLGPPVQHPDAPKRYRAPLPISAIAAIGESMLVGGYHEILEFKPDGQLVRRIPGQGERTYSLRIHPTKENRLISCSGTPGELGEVREFDLKSGRLRSVIARSDEVIMDAAPSPDGQRLAIGMPDGTVRLFEGESWSSERSLLGHSAQVTALQWDASGTRLATASKDHTAKIFDVARGQSVATFTGHKKSVNAIAFLDANQVVSAGSDGMLLLWSAKDGRKQKDVLKADVPLLALSVGKSQILASGAGQAFCIDIANQANSTQLDVGQWAGAASGASDQFVIGTQHGEAIVVKDRAIMHRFRAAPN